MSDKEELIFLHLSVFFFSSKVLKCTFFALTFFFLLAIRDFIVL